MLRRTNSKTRAIKWLSGKRYLWASRPDNLNLILGSQKVAGKNRFLKVVSDRYAPAVINACVSV